MKTRNPKAEIRPVLRSSGESNAVFEIGEGFDNKDDLGADTAEGGKKSEGRNPKRSNDCLGLGISGSFWISTFGFRISPVFALLLNCHLTPALAAAIPDRPEKLSFPPLKYEPPAPEKFRMPLRSGPIAYVVPDRELPLVNIVVYVRTGKYLEPAGKEGLADLTGYLLARGGIKSKTAEELEERLAFLAAQLSSGIGETQGSVSLNLLAKDLEEGVAILREVLSEPRFQEDKIALRKQQLLQEMKERNDDSAAIEGREHGFLASGEN